MSFIRVGTQTIIDLSWNPIINSYAIKNYFFYNEDRTIPASPKISYYSYALPVPNNSTFLSAAGVQEGYDINNTSTYSLFLSSGFSNYFDLTYGGEIELSWLYHSDVPILDICSNATASQTTMSLSVFKSDSNSLNNTTLVNNVRRTYDSYTNLRGAIPINNGKTMKDVFTITFDSSIIAANKIFKPSDIIQINISFSNLSYVPYNATSLTDTRSYSIIVKDLTITPYRASITQLITSALFGYGLDTGFQINKYNALVSNSVEGGGVLYYMPSLTNPLKTYERASLSLSWLFNYDLSGVNTTTSFPYSLRVRAYLRPFANSSASSYTTDPSVFVNQNNNLLIMDISKNYTAIYSQINGSIVTTTFELSGQSFLSTYNQIVFLFTLDMSMNLPQYSSKTFSLIMKSYTLTPHQYYRFSGPDPTLASSYALNSPTKTTYMISDPYTSVTPFYRVYNLINGSYYAFKIAANNFFGTSAYSMLATGRCGSVANRIFGDNYSVEAENQRNQITIIWDKPVFSGYEIVGYRVQFVNDVNGRWLDIFDYTPDLSQNDVSFNTFYDLDVPISSFGTTDTRYTYINNTSSLITYRLVLREYRYLSGLSLPYGTITSGSLINGVKYYLRVAGINQLGIGTYSSIKSGIPTTIPEGIGINTLKKIVGSEIIYMTWQIPHDDGGAPILDYVIEYTDVYRNASNVVTGYGIFKQFLIDNQQPKDKLVDYKFIHNNKNSTDSAIQQQVSTKKTALLKYMIPPDSISLYDIDVNNSNLLYDPTKMTIIKQTNQTYTYISNDLIQNVFDLSNIEFKWYYLPDPSNVGLAYWDSSTSISFNFSVTAYLTDNYDVIQQKLFSLKDLNGRDLSYNVTMAKLSNVSGGASGFKYIGYGTGNDISSNGITNLTLATVPITGLPRINDFRRIRIDFSANNLSSGSLPSSPKFNIYIAPVILNGRAPLRTSSSLTTNFTYKIFNNPATGCLLQNNKEYIFRITPFNVSDYFQNLPQNSSQDIIGSDNAFSISDLNYSFVTDNSGGKVVFTWKYFSNVSYFIQITIPDEYIGNTIQNEYPISAITDYSIATSDLIRDANNNITYTIPSSNLKPRLTNGRAYNVQIAPIKAVIINNIQKAFVAPYFGASYIIPMTIPSRPDRLSSRGFSNEILLSWALPDITKDPNYYKTDDVSTYYNYKTYILEYSTELSTTWLPVISSASPVSPITILTSTATGDIQTCRVSGLINETNYRFRVALTIKNETISQTEISSYTYISTVNNTPLSESSGNLIYPSSFPYKSTVVQNFNIWKINSVTNQFGMGWITPNYNGNALFYKYNFEYSLDNIVWTDIFATNGGIADINSGANAAGPSTLTATVFTSVNYTITCRSSVIAPYIIRINAIGYINTFNENPNLSRRAISDYVSSTIIL